MHVASSNSSVRRKTWLRVRLFAEVLVQTGRAVITHRASLSQASTLSVLFRVIDIQVLVSRCCPGHE